jgi:hypothetical protein
MRLLYLLFFLLPSVSLLGQRINAAKADFKDFVSGSLFYSMNNEPVLTREYESLESGSPFFQDKWMKAYIVLGDKKVYKDVSSKLNLLKGTIHYLDNKGNEMIVNPAVKEIVFTSEDLAVNYRFLHHSSFLSTTKNVKSGWYQWLYSGKAGLYKYQDKKLEERKAFGSASVRQYIHTKEKYFVLLNSEFLEIQKPKDLIPLFPAHKVQLENKIKNLDRTLPLEEQLLLLVEYIQSLQATA